MRDARFWKVIALLAVAGLFYLGHGLHHPGGVQLPSLTSQAYANGVAVQEGSIAVTCSEDGRTVYYFGPRRAASTFNTTAFQYLGAVTAQ